VLRALTIPVIIFAIIRVTGVDDRTWLIQGWGYLLLGLISACLSVYLERRNRPPVMQFWEDDSGFALTVRHVQTGEVLFRAKEPRLTGRYLREVRLEGANLAGVDLSESDLQGVDLRGADLRNASLASAKLQGARLRGADLRSACLIGADLTGADLSRTCLGTASMKGACLAGADLRGANLVGRGAEQVLWDAQLGGANFQGARCNAATRWPLRFDPVAAGCVYEYGREADFPIPAAASGADCRTLPLAAGRTNASANDF